MILKIGGSIIQGSDGEVKIQRLQEYSKIIKSSDNIRGLVFGGGYTAKKYINAGKEFNLSNEELDWIGIYSTHVHAGTMSHILGADYELHRDLSEIDSTEAIPVLGGTEPGHTTDAVSLSLASKLKSDRVVICTDVDGIYNKDPTSYEDADKYDEISTEKLSRLLEEYTDDPGRSLPIDKKSISIMEENNIEVIIFDGTKPSNLNSVLESKNIGTRITL